MKELKINVFSFEELSKKIQDKVIERERWNIMDCIMECHCMEFRKTLVEFQKITDSYVTSYEVDYCGCRFGKVRSDKIYKIMDIAILNYSTGEVTLIGNCPDSWEEEQIEEYIYGKDGLNLRESDTYYMCGDISLVSKKYKP